MGSVADVNNFCDGRISVENSGVGDCSSLSSRNHPIYEKLYSCVGKATCEVPVSGDISIGSQRVMGNECTTSASSIFFVQYYCRVGDEELDSKRHTALMASAVTIFAVLGLFTIN
jgi:hypothetical protein